MRKGVSKPTKTDVAIPARDEWDFEGLANGSVGSCWGYEYARECQWIIDEYQARSLDRAANPIREGVINPIGFDEFGNLYIEKVFYGNDEDDIQGIVDLELPPGFPDTPYLRIAHRRHKWERESWPAIRKATPHELKTPSASVVAIWIDWSKCDKELTGAFAAWLTSGDRPRRATERRGKSGVRRVRADLKALGAYRLLKLMTAEEAYQYTARESRARKPLFSKIPDWYRAKRRALHIIRQTFRAEV